MYTPEFLAECEGRLAQAAAAAQGQAVYEQRVALHAEGLRSARAYRTICDAMQRGDFAAALREYDQTIQRLQAVIASGGANREYGTAYLERFLSKTVRQGAEATAPPNRVLQVLPDRWRFSLDESDTGNEQGFHRTDLDDAAWPLVATHSTTLDTQGYDKYTVLWYRTRFDVPGKHDRLTLFFGEVDGASEVYVNGQKIPVPEPAPSATKPAAAPAPGVKPPREGLAKARTPFEVDVTAAVRPGENVLAVRVDHSKMTELALGGIIRPVLLIAKPK
jgi:hypothetical protein